MPRDARTGRPPLDEDSLRHVRQDLLEEKGVTLAIVKTYAAIRDHVGWEPAKDNFLIAWPTEATIAEGAGVHRASVSAAVRFLVERDYLIVERKPNRPSTYGLILDRRDFRAEKSRADAIARWLARRQELGQVSRSGQAQAASKNRTSRQQGITGRKSKRGDMRPQVAVNRRVEATSGCRPGAIVDSRRHEPDKDLDLKNQIQGNQSATDVAPLVSVSIDTPELPRDNGNSHRPAVPVHRCDPKGDLKARYLQSCPDCQQRLLWRDRFYEPQLRKMGFRPPADQEAAQ